MEEHKTIPEIIPANIFAVWLLDADIEDCMVCGERNFALSTPYPKIYDASQCGYWAEFSAECTNSVFLKI